ncbi:intermembrane phospholipid transport protein YdbH family protein [Pseudomonas zhanjiangensis]|uniref:YdbH domain-containing protein n=1 Tax=Pseudomonas zhanjiangensis TaxID=3239015 RepID=A0ABV3YVS0_9PSED
MDAPIMNGRRTWLRTLGLLALLLLLGGYGYFSWTRLVAQQHIRQIDWQGASIALNGIRLAHLSLLRQDAQGSLRLEAEGLQLGWRAFGPSPPFWQDMQIARLALDWRPVAERQPAAPSNISADLQALSSYLSSYLSMLPQRLQIDQLLAELPCARGRCSLQGTLRMLGNARTPAGLEAQLDLEGDDQLSWRAQVQGPPDALAVQMTLAVNGQQQLRLDSSLISSAKETLWLAELAAPDLSQAMALHRWLEQWLPSTSPPPPPAPSAATVAATWRLRLAPGSLDLGNLQNASGDIEARVSLSEPWSIPGIGRVQGQLALAVHATAGEWFAERLEGDLQLQPTSTAWLNALPPPLRADVLRLRMQSSGPLTAVPSSLTGRALPLAIELSSLGPVRFDLQGKAAVANAPPWAVELEDATLTATSEQLTLYDWKAHDLKAKLRLSAHLDSEQLRLDLATGSTLEAGDLQNGDLHLLGLSGELQGTHLIAQWPEGSAIAWQAAGQTGIRTERLEHAALQPQGWKWRGKFDADQDHVALDGRLSTDTSLQLMVQAHLRMDQRLHVTARLEELFLRAGNPLRQTFTNWPALLDLSNGRLNASARLDLAAIGQPPAIQLDLTGKGISGIYDRTEFSGLNTQLRLSLDQRRLSVELAQLDLEQANPGIPFGPLQLNGRYQASTIRPRLGRLLVRQAEAAVLGGKVRLGAKQWDLAEPILLFPLELQGLQLTRLFNIYPAEGLAGSGTLDGRLPLRLSANGIAIDHGQVYARPPGGRLRFDSERIRALGQSNPTMRLVAQSLQDFRFATLSSQVDYHPEGKLNLALRLEGQNPTIEQGRPIHLNVNLEEDIPSLLASLQLTDKVNETIKLRVQQRLLQRSTPAAPEEP